MSMNWGSVFEAEILLFMTISSIWEGVSGVKRGGSEIEQGGVVVYSPVLSIRLGRCIY